MARGQKNNFIMDVQQMHQILNKVKSFFLKGTRAALESMWIAQLSVTRSRLFSTNYLTF